MITWEQEMATWEEDQKFKRDTIAEIDREYGRVQERERIVAIITDLYNHRRELATRYRRANFDLYQQEQYVMSTLVDLIGEISK